MEKVLLAGLLAEEMREAFFDWIREPEFPCVAAKTAVHNRVCRVEIYDELASPEATAALGRDLLAFIEENRSATSDYCTFAAVFRQPLELDEPEFESLLWTQLRRLNRRDAAEHFAWDPAVSADPGDPHFGFSFGERAFFIVGLHARSSREARRFRWPTLVFNFHEQFERLRAVGKMPHMQRTIRERDRQLQGSVNPMLSDFGDASEARQYSGRAVGEEWQAPFTPAQLTESPPSSPAPSSSSKCPFHP